MEINKESKMNSLHGIAQLALFVTSYFPLFALVIIHQVSENYAFLNYGAFDGGLINSFFKIWINHNYFSCFSIGLFGYGKHYSI